MLEIEKNIPVPLKGNGRGAILSEVRSTMTQMEVGDSIPLGSDKRRRMEFYNALRYEPTLAGKKFITREMSDGYRAWRMK